MTRSAGKSDLVTIYTSMGQLRAEVIKSKLEAVGIPALLRYEAAGRAIGIIIDGLGEVQVQVPREFEEDALALIEPLEAEDGALEDDEWDEEWDLDEGEDEPER